MEPYCRVPIEECGEPLVDLSAAGFSKLTPHPYQVLGAPYGNLSPYRLRQGVVDALLAARVALWRTQPGWNFQIFDAYRPVAVQQFMVDYTARELAKQQGAGPFEQLSVRQQQAILSQVYQFWALPSLDLKTPPPHSTGAAVDLTLVDEQGQPVEMGSPIDEVSERSHPDYFQQFSDAASRQVQAHRAQLRAALATAGFQQHPHEWWHFSLGDQLWAWRCRQLGAHTAVAYYGGVIAPDGASKKQTGEDSVRSSQKTNPPAV